MKENQTSIGRRKSAIAQVNIKEGNGNITINNKQYEIYLQNNPKLDVYKSPLTHLSLYNKYDINIISRGGGLKGQAEAIKLGISRALYEKLEENNRIKLKIEGFLTRNSLCKERKKYGLKKARKAPQFSKR
uniref:Small ribosomal subunit protein uS9c n=1 Tax=Discoplastis spathirhyncha TaxID=215771 RepID=A0A3G3LL87_9EUGL|nr:ribosomal protein S9 [Discoplastis spathirhyncha]AYQ93484.1 ribosomal protein S9 [Discoplastis spathirhyncha]